MKRINFISIVLLAILTLSCNNKAKEQQERQTVLNKYEAYGVLDAGANLLGVGVEAVDYGNRIMIRYGIDNHRFENHFDKLSDRWIVLNGETLAKIATDSIKKGGDRHCFYIDMNQEELKDIKCYLVCFAGVDASEWEERATSPLFYVVVKGKDNTLTVLNKKPLNAEKLFSDANIVPNESPLPVIHKTVRTVYHYETTLANGEKMTAVIDLFTEGEAKSINFDFEWTAGGSSFHIRSGQRVDVAIDGAFTILNDESVQQGDGKVGNNSVTGTITKGSTKYQYTATLASEEFVRQLTIKRLSEN